MPVSNLTLLTLSGRLFSDDFLLVSIINPPRS